MAVRKYKPTTPGRRGASVSAFEEITRAKPEQLARREGPRTEPAERARPDHHPAPGRRPQAPLPRDRLPARQGRRAGQGRAHRVRPEPHRADRAAALRRRREALHPRARTACEVGDRLVAARAPTIRPGNALPLRNIPVGTMVHAVELKPGGGARWRARPARASSSWPRRAAGHAAPALRRDPPGRRSTAAPRSARSATPSTS